MKIQNIDDVVFKLFQTLGAKWERYLRFIGRGASEKGNWSSDREGKHSGKVPRDSVRHVRPHWRGNFSIYKTPTGKKRLNARFHATG